MPRALVTGGSGYVGRVVVGALRARGYDVQVFDRVDADDRPADVGYVRGDIRDAEAVRRACEGVDVVHHDVAEVPLARDTARFDSVNVGGARNILAAAEAARVKKTVFVSSSAVLGVPDENPVDERAPIRPCEAYGASKAAAERLAASYVARGLDVTVVRPRTVLGRDRLGIFQIVFELARRGRALYVVGRGDNRYQFVDACDLADACVRAGERAGPDLFHVGAERFGTMREALEALARHAGAGSPVRSLPRRPAEAMLRVASRLHLAPLAPYHALMYGRSMVFDVRHAREVLGWRATRSNEEMLLESYDHYVAHRDRILGRHAASRHRSPVRRGILRMLELLP